MAVTRCSLAELTERLTFAHVREELSITNRVAAVVVEFTAMHRVTMAPARFADLLGELTAVTVAVLPDLYESPADDYAASFDVVVPASDPGRLEVVLGAVTGSPLAAVTLALLLRGGEGRSLTDGLVAESMAYSLLQAGPEFAAWRRGRPVRTRPPEIGPAVLTERLDDMLHITLARPHVHNAFSVRLRDGLVHALEPAHADPSIERVIIDGAGPSFCSGGDLDEFGSFPDPAEAHVIRLTRHAGRSIAQLAPAVEVRIHGSTLGSGIELAAFAGTVVAAPDTVIALPEVALGLVPGAGGTVSIPRRIGRQRTAYLALTGVRITAATALEWGLVDRVADPDALDAGGFSG